MPIADVIAGKSRWAVECADALTALAFVPDASVDAIVTDPPYGIVNQFGEIKTRKGYGDGRASGTRSLQFSWDGPEVAESVSRILAAACRAAKRSAALWCFTGLDHVSILGNVCRNAGFTIKPAAWVKECPPPAGMGNWWPSGFELAFYGYRGGAWFGDTDVKRCNVFWSDSYRHGQPGKVDHPTQKPLALMGRIVTGIVPQDGICLDPFCGSGSTGVACLENGRRFIGYEINPEYAELARKRLANVMPMFAGAPDDYLE